VEIRRASDADWPALWSIWHEVVAAGETYPWDPEADETIARNHWMPPAPAETWLAESDGDVVGTYIVSANRPGLGAHMATASFMVASKARGKGAGRALGEHCLERAKSLGYQGMQFNAVVETNTSAVALWQALGFVIVGTVPAAHRHPTHGLVGIHIMHRSL
jgi:L-amino acid N-acyltransferase YncA